MKSVLPEDSQEEIPVGFSIVGHVGMSFLLPYLLTYKTEH